MRYSEKRGDRMGGAESFHAGLFYVWWMFINGFLSFFEMRFLQDMAGARRRISAAVCLFASCALTFLTMYLQSSELCRMLLHTGIIFCFSVFAMKFKVFEAVAPAAVILTLYSFMEGFQNVLMSRLVEKSMSEQMGIAVQFAVTGVLAVLTAGSLCFIAKKSASMRKERESSYRHVLDDLDEVKRRNERYLAFQHDIDNHLLVVQGLVQEKRYEEAEEYYGNLKVRSDSLAAGIHTGNLAADVLLKEKAGLAESKGIKVSCDVHFSRKFFIEDADLCTILANGMDNAIQACMKESQEKREITVKAGMKHQFLILNMTNTYNAPELKPLAAGGADGSVGGLLQESDYGVGLRNVKRTVEKYGGTMRAEQEQGKFCLRMMLCLEPSAKGASLSDKEK